MNLRIALVSANAALPLDEDMPPLKAALASAGVEVTTPSWDDAAVDWGGVTLALLRSPWDYVDRIDEFLAWCGRCAAQTRLLNPPEVVRWNTDKHYLLHLAQAGVPVVPTRFVEPGSDAAHELARFLAGGSDALSAGVAGPFTEFVVKPSIGAGSRDAARYGRDETGRARQHVARLLAAGRSVMLQPYLHRVDDCGETAVLYLGGEYSHAIRKGPLLQAGAGLVEGLFAPEDIRPRQPDDAELAVAAAAYASIPFEPPLYARIDLIRDQRGAPVVLELELTEPSLFLAHAPGSAERLVRHLLRLCPGGAAAPEPTGVCTDARFGRAPLTSARSSARDAGVARTLFLYHGVYGQTRKICERLQAQLAAGGAQADVVPLGDGGADPAAYDTIVIGASIRHGKHNPAVLEFIEQHLALLQARPSAFFSVSLIARKPTRNTPDSNPYVKAFLARSPWQPRLVGVFGGELDYQRYGPFDRHVIRFIMWLNKGPTDLHTTVEFTDWDAVSRFGSQLAALAAGRPA